MEIEPGETMTVSYDAPKLELKENDGVVSFRDDFPCYGPLAQRLNSQQKNLIDKVFPTSLPASASERAFALTR